MRGSVLLLTLFALAAPMAAQQALIDETITIETLPLELFSDQPVFQEPLIQPATTAELGALLRALDKISGAVVDFDLTPGQTKQLGRIQVTLAECRYPSAKSSTPYRRWIFASWPAAGPHRW